MSEEQTARQVASAWLNVYSLGIHEWADGAYPKLDTLTREFESFGRHAKAAAEAEVAKLTRERDEARADQKAAEDANDALNLKLDALAPHGSCACSYDKPGDVCLHHSPALVAANARVAVLEEALKQIAAHPRDYDDGRQSFGIGYAFGNIKNIARTALTPGGENAKS